jgi:hypothetical protein
MRVNLYQVLLSFLWMAVAASAALVDLNSAGLSLSYISKSYSSVDDESSFTYLLQNEGAGGNVSFLLNVLPICASSSVSLVSTSPSSATEATEPQSGLVGSKWDNIGE